MSATPSESALRALHPELRDRLRQLERLERRERQAARSRWQSPPPPEREAESWMVTYLDLITLLLVMLVVLLGLSRLPLSGEHGDGAPAHAVASEASPVTDDDDTHALARATALSAGAAPDDGDSAFAADDAVSTSAGSPVDAPSLRAASTVAGVPAAPVHALLDALHPGPGLALASVAPGMAQEPPALDDQPVSASLDVIEPPGPRGGDGLRLPFSASSESAADGRWSLPTFAALAAQIPGLPPLAGASGYAHAVSAGPTAPADDREVPADTAAGTATAPDVNEPPTAASLGLGDLGEGIEVIVNEQSVSFRISNELLFPSGQSDLADAGPEVLDRLASVVARHPYPLSVEGHTDPVPIQNERFPSNWELSTGRATSVLRHLARSGVAADRLRAVGYADTRPIADNDTAAGRAINRRVELIMEIPPATP